MVHKVVRDHEITAGGFQGNEVQPMRNGYGTKAQSSIGKSVAHHLSTFDMELDLRVGRQVFALVKSVAILSTNHIVGNGPTALKRTNKRERKVQE